MRIPRFLRSWLPPRVPVIELRGMLAARDGALALRSMAPLIDRAFAAAAESRMPVILDIDSPGGSPVQSELIAARIRRRAEEKGVRVVAVIEEVGASGGYWLACAADEIRAGAMSIVGSIGVVGGGFGFPGLLNRAGVERRLYTAGRNKARLDPFSPEREEDVAFYLALMEQVHGRFVGWVRSRRGAKLAEDDAVFDGSFFLGEQALPLGLVDVLADLEETVRALGGPKARASVFRPKRRRLFGRLPRLLARGAAEAALDVLDERSLRPTLRA